MDLTDVAFVSASIVVTVVLRRRRLLSGHCGFKTRHRYDTRLVESRRRHLDLGMWRQELRASLHRLRRCPLIGIYVSRTLGARCTVRA